MRSARREGFRARGLLALAVLAWFAIALWNSVKPLPPGTHVASLSSRLAESEVLIIHDSSERRELRSRELSAIDEAEQLIVLDELALERALAERLLTRKRQRPNIRIVVVSDPADSAHGGTPAGTLDALERAGIIVARARLTRLRDPSALYSALWRWSVGWWSDPFDESTDPAGVRSWLRSLNHKADHRQLIAADDGSGGWRCLLPASADGDLAVEISGALAREVVASELSIAAWSTDDDRLPPTPPIPARGLGSIDARFLTEGAIRAALLDALAASGAQDEIHLSARLLSERAVIAAALRAERRGAHLSVLLDPGSSPNPAVAGELMSEGDGRIEVRWLAPAKADTSVSMAIFRHRNERLCIVGAADLTRPSLEDYNLEAAVELRAPERAQAARALDEYFDAKWTAALRYPRHADESRAAYWRYRALEVGGFATF